MPKSLAAFNGVPRLGRCHYSYNGEEAAKMYLGKGLQ